MDCKAAESNGDKSNGKERKLMDGNAKQMMGLDSTEDEKKGKDITG